MPELLDNRIRIPPYIWRYFCLRAKEENRDPRQIIVDLATDYAFHNRAINREAIPERTPTNVKKAQESALLETNNQSNMMQELLNADQLFNWD